MSERDVIVIGAGLGGLTAAALLAKRGLEVLVVERNCGPGGSCSAFRRRGRTLDLGAAMLFGFGERGFNPHRFVMNELEEGLDVYRHEAMYRLHYPDASGRDRQVVFWPEPERFFEELSRLFPEAIGEVRRLYRDLEKLYGGIVSANSVFLAPTETPKEELLAGLLRHPITQARLLSLLSKSALSLMRRRLRDRAALRFFDKLTSTYSYTTLEETPAALAITMFVENHVGGSYYPAGSPMMLAARLEKALEKFGGTIRYDSTVARIVAESGRAVGVELEGGEVLRARDVVFGGNVWDLYERLLPRDIVPPELRRKVGELVPSYPSSVLYGAVADSAVPAGAFPVEMLIGPAGPYGETPAEGGTPRDGGPRPWPAPSDPEYRSERYARAKEIEAERMLDLVERRFPGFKAGVAFSELGSPSTIERYLLKRGGAVAGPKSCMGQELMNRQAATTFLPSLWACGESTVMGTGTPAVTISGISAATALLRSRGLPEYRARPSERQYVRVIPRGTPGNRPLPAFAGSVLCQWCETSPCRAACPAGIDVMGIMRRIEADNLDGARKRLREAMSGGAYPCASCAQRPCLSVCSRREVDERPVPIPELLSELVSFPTMAQE
jgi:prolycopene isomerase